MISLMDEEDRNLFKLDPAVLRDAANGQGKLNTRQASKKGGWPLGKPQKRNHPWRRTMFIGNYQNALKNGFVPDKG